MKFGLWQKRKKAVAQTGMFWCVHGSRWRAGAKASGRHALSYFKRLVIL